MKVTCKVCNTSKILKEEKLDPYRGKIISTKCPNKQCTHRIKFEVPLINKVVNEISCPNCDSILAENTKFCRNCGHKMGKPSGKAKPSSKARIATKNITETPSTENISIPYKKDLTRWMLYYIIVNVLLSFTTTGDDEAIGLFIFSVAVLGILLYSIKKKKEKPYSVVLKIILVLQSLLAISGIMIRLEYLDSGNGLFAIISFALLVFLNVKLILKRNK